MPEGNHDLLINEQIAYYQSRAKEYDEWFLRQGRYDRGPELNARWFQEIELLRQALSAFKPAGDILELACGTGLWTKQLLSYAKQITAVDAAAEMLAINESQIQSPKVCYCRADLFAWKPDKQYDVVFFSFWLSHVPPERFAAFWQMIDLALSPGGRVFFIDSLYEPTSTAKDHQLGGMRATVVKRQLNDGREYHIVKVFYEARNLSEKLYQAGWNFSVAETLNYFIFGQGDRQNKI